MANRHDNPQMKKDRDALHKAGLRPARIWVTDTRRPGFVEECRRQCLLAAKTDRADGDMHRFMDEAFANTDGWRS